MQGAPETGHIGCEWLDHRCTGVCVAVHVSLACSVLTALCWLGFPRTFLTPPPPRLWLALVTGSGGQHDEEVVRTTTDILLLLSGMHQHMYVFGETAACWMIQG